MSHPGILSDLNRAGTRDLRDRLAAAALTGLLAYSANTPHESIARRAYEWADLLLKVRDEEVRDGNPIGSNQFIDRQ